MKLIIKFNILAALLCLVGSVKADNAPNIRSLLKDKVTLSRAWQLSDNYSKGLTVEVDHFKALAWQYVYVTLLPHAYPGLQQLLKPFKEKVSIQKHDDAFEYSKALKSNYQLPSRMDENQLIRVFEANEQDINIVSMDEQAYRTFDKFLLAVAREEPDLTIRYKNKMRTLKEEYINSKIVYGQVIVNGSELEETIIRNQAIDIDKHGFFIAKLSKQLLLTAKGYQTFFTSLELNSTPKVESLGRIVLNPLPKTQLSSIVGSLTSAKKMSSIGLTLKLKDQYINKDEPWFTPSLVVTKLDNGQFYVKDLSAGSYELIVSYKGKRIHQDINLGSSQVKTIKALII